MAALASRLAPWRRQVTERLRAARKALRGGLDPVPAGEAEGLRQAILAGEIESERIAQAVLEAATPEAAGRETIDPAPAAVAAGLAAAMALAAPPGDDGRRALAALVAAACPRAGDGAIASAMAAFA